MDNNSSLLNSKGNLLTNIELKHGDCLEVLKTLPDNSVDSVVTDPPYGISFMNKKWDYNIPSIEVWKEVLRVLKPGGHLLSACGTRTQHRMVCNIEDAGFEIRDVITWLYGSGFPKSYNIAKGIESLVRTGSANGKDWKELGGKEYEQKTGYVKMQYEQGARPDYSDRISRDIDITTPEAKEWLGWGTALKPSCEFWTLARKPISEKSVPANVLKWGTGGINIDATRIEFFSDKDKSNLEKSKRTVRTGVIGLCNGESGFMSSNADGEVLDGADYINQLGRFPANLILDEESAILLDEQGGNSRSSKQIRRNSENHKESFTCGKFNDIDGKGYGDSGGVSRFFYIAKASKSERNAGVEDLPKQTIEGQLSFLDEGGYSNNTGAPNKPISNQNFHPTIKPITLMRYLIKLVTPAGGTVLDPFMGSGSTGCACVLEGIDFIGIEIDSAYLEISRKRIDYWKKKK